MKKLTDREVANMFPVGGVVRGDPGKTIDGRTFETGAYRDTEEGKNDYAGFLSPLVIRAFGDYMRKHQLQSNGEMRRSDNWKSMFGEHHNNVCLSSAWRHFLDLWMENEGFRSRDGLDEAIGGLLFNVMSYWYKILVERENNNANEKLS